jgi:hypothetical protein
MFRVALAASLVLAAVATAGLGAPTRAETAFAPARTIAPASQLPQLLGLVDGALVRVDPQSLEAIPGKRIRVGSGGCASRQGGTACWSITPWSVSPNGRQLAVARNDMASLTFVDAAGMRITASVKIEGRAIGALVWLAPRRLLAVQEVPDEGQRLLVIDVLERRVVARRPLGGTVIELARSGRELVMLLAPVRTVGAARIAVADRRGVVRFARLGRIRAGSKLLPGRGHRVNSRLPGLALDPAGRRAFVVDESLVAKVDLGSLAISNHALERKRSLLARLWSRLEPAASAKVISGHHRQASWLGGGLLAVSGSNTEQGRMQPAGLLVVDTRTWEARTIDSGGTSFMLAGDLLLAWGGSWDAAAQRTTGIGLQAYDPQGAKRFGLFDGEYAWPSQLYGGRAYVGISGEEELRVVDLATGNAVATRSQALPWLLLGSGDGWWGAY